MTFFTCLDWLLCLFTAKLKILYRKQMYSVLDYRCVCRRASLFGANLILRRALMCMCTDMSIWQGIFERKVLWRTLNILMMYLSVSRIVFFHNYRVLYHRCVIILPGQLCYVLNSFYAHVFFFSAVMSQSYLFMSQFYLCDVLTRLLQ